MAARIRKIRQTDDTRAKIQASVFIGYLTKHIEGSRLMTPSQVAAAKILLDKSLPNLSDLKVDHSSQGVTFNLNVPTS